MLIAGTLGWSQSRVQRAATGRNGALRWRLATGIFSVAKSLPNMRAKLPSTALMSLEACSWLDHLASTSQDVTFE